MPKTNTAETMGPRLSLAAEIQTSGLSDEFIKKGLAQTERGLASVCRYKSRELGQAATRWGEDATRASKTAGYHQETAARLRGVAKADTERLARLSGRDEESRQLAAGIKAGWESGERLWQNLCWEEGTRHHGWADLYADRASWLQFIVEHGPQELADGLPAGVGEPWPPKADEPGPFVRPLDSCNRLGLEQNLSQLTHWESWLAEQSAGAETRSDDHYLALIDDCYQRAERCYMWGRKNPEDAGYYEELARENEQWAIVWQQWLLEPPSERVSDQTQQRYSQQLMGQTQQLVKQYSEESEACRGLAESRRSLAVAVETTTEERRDHRLEFASGQLLEQRHRDLRQQISDQKIAALGYQRQATVRLVEARQVLAEAETLQAQAQADQNQARIYEDQAAQTPDDTNRDYYDWLRSTVDSLNETIDDCESMIKLGLDPGRFQGDIDSCRGELELYQPALEAPGESSQAWEAYNQILAQSFHQAAEDKLAGANRGWQTEQLRRAEALRLQQAADELRQAAETLKGQVDSDNWWPGEEVALRFWLEFRDRKSRGCDLLAAQHEGQASEWLERAREPLRSVDEYRVQATDWAARAGQWDSYLANPASLSAQAA